MNSKTLSCEDITTVELTDGKVLCPKCGKPVSEQRSVAVCLDCKFTWAVIPTVFAYVPVSVERKENAVKTDALAETHQQPVTPSFPAEIMQEIGIPKPIPEPPAKDTKNTPEPKPAEPVLTSEAFCAICGHEFVRCRCAKARTLPPASPIPPASPVPPAPEKASTAPLAPLLTEDDFCPSCGRAKANCCCHKLVAPPFVPVGGLCDACGHEKTLCICAPTENVTDVTQKGVPTPSCEEVSEEECQKYTECRGCPAEFWGEQ